MLLRAGFERGPCHWDGEVAQAAEADLEMHPPCPDVANCAKGDVPHTARGADAFQIAIEAGAEWRHREERGGIAPSKLSGSH